MIASSEDTEASCVSTDARTRKDDEVPRDEGILLTHNKGGDLAIDGSMHGLSTVLSEISRTHIKKCRMISLTCDI